MIVSVRFDYRPQKGKFFTFYPAQGARENLGTSVDELSEVVNSFEDGAHIIVCGDFNGDIGCLGGSRGIKTPGPRGRLVANFFKRHDLLATNLQPYATGPINTFFSHNGASCLDYVAIPEVLDKLVGECHVEEWHPLNNSDHSMLSITMNFGNVDSYVYPAPSAGRVKWSKLNHHEMKRRYNDRLDTLPLGIKGALDISEGNHSDIDNCFTKLTSAMLRISDDLPKTKYRKNLKPFWNQTLSRLKKEKVKFYRGLGMG